MRWLRHLSRKAVRFYSIKSEGWKKQIVPVFICFTTSSQYFPCSKTILSGWERLRAASSAGSSLSSAEVLSRQMLVSPLRCLHLRGVVPSYFTTIDGIWLMSAKSASLLASSLVLLESATSLLLNLVLTMIWLLLPTSTSSATTILAAAAAARASSPSISWHPESINIINIQNISQAAKGGWPGRGENQLAIQSTQYIKLAMLAVPSRKTKLIIQDLNKLSLLERNPFTARQSSAQARPSHKKSLLSNLRRNCKAEEGMGSSKGLSHWGEPPESAFSSRKIVFLPQQSFESGSSRDCGESEEKLRSYSSMRLNRVAFHRLEKNISERYQRRIEVLKELRAPRVSQQLFTISHFTREALHSIPKHVEIFNEKLRLLKKATTPPEPALPSKDSPMPAELRTVRVAREGGEAKAGAQPCRKTQGRFRMYLSKKAKRDEANPQIYRIEGWKQQKSEKSGQLYD